MNARRPGAKGSQQVEQEPWNSRYFDTLDALPLARSARTWSPAITGPIARNVYPRVACGSKAGLFVKPGPAAISFTAARSDVTTLNSARYFVAAMDAVEGRAKIIRCALTKPGMAASSGAWCSS